MISLVSYPQTDSILCLPVNEVKILYIGFKQNKICDSLIFNYEDRISGYDKEIGLLNKSITLQDSIIKIDSIKLSQKDIIINACDKQIDHAKKQRNIVGLVALIALFLAIF